MHPLLPTQQSLVAGVDEVGRGPLAGPVIAAAVILDPLRPITGLTDSKRLTPKKRQTLAGEIRLYALDWALGRADVEEIDLLNIFHASLLAMRRAIEGLSLIPDHIKIDGKHCPSLGTHYQGTLEAIIKGDLTEAEISAASIIAKVARDEEMIGFDSLYPVYGFASHKGYPTRQHREALMQHGVLPIHRRSFAPVKKLITQE